MLLVFVLFCVLLLGLLYASLGSRMSSSILGLMFLGSNDSCHLCGVLDLINVVHRCEKRMRYQRECI